VHPTQALTGLGGASDFKTLLRLTSRTRLRTAVRAGEVLTSGRGMYVLPTAHAGLNAAARLSGTASHASAAALHRWELATHRTVLDCAIDLPFTEALAIADSALRRRDVDHDHLVELALAVPSNGRRQAIRVVEEASALAANPFESVLRAIALDVPGLRVSPQEWIEEHGFRGRPDLVDRDRRLVLEAESFEFHGGRKELKRDCERYNALVVRGWTVARFAWEHVMFEQDYVRDCLVSLAGEPRERATLPPTLLYTA
jgi:very-short-patch-repair endonuclease